MDDVCAALKVHTQIEEEIFYPAAREALPDQQDLFDQAISEHAAAKDLIAQVESGAASDEATCDKFLELSDAIDQHVREEEDEMFPRLRDTSMDMEDIGARLATRKRELESEAARTASTLTGDEIRNRLTGLRG